MSEPTLERRTVQLVLPSAVWRLIELEADALKRSQSRQCSQLIVTAYESQGLLIPREASKVA